MPPSPSSAEPPILPESGAREMRGGGGGGRDREMDRGMEGMMEEAGTRGAREVRIRREGGRTFIIPLAPPSLSVLVLLSLAVS